MMKQSLKERFHEVDRVPTPWDDAATRRASVEVVPLRARTARGRSVRKPSFLVSLGVAAAVVVGLVVVLPTMGGDGAPNRAFAVTENADDTVTVEIRSIEDAEGLQRRLQEAGVPAAVYYLPPGKVCSPRGYDGGSPPIEDRQAEMEGQRLTITESEDGASAFTVDRSRLLPRLHAPDPDPARRSGLGRAVDRRRVHLGRRVALRACGCRSQRVAVPEGLDLWWMSDAT
jgi:hypothetical protein